MENHRKMTEARIAVRTQKPDQAKPTTRWATIGACVAAAILAALFVAQPLSAQVAGTGNIQGTVSDSTGNVIQGASVKATYTATGQLTETTSSAAGFYVLGQVQPGEYTVEFRASGFEPLRQEHVNVGPISTVGLNITLKVGAASAEITVTAAPVALDTENGTLASDLPAEAYSTLPVVMSDGPKSPLAFAALMPATYDNTPFGNRGFVTNGGQQGATDIYVNGMPIPSVELAGDTIGINFDMNPEDVGSFQAIMTGVPAYYTGQGVINLVSKSGTNKIHGDVYENVRNTAFDAPGVFSLGVVPVEHQNEYGASVGGPILKNRVFAFFNLDRYDFSQAATPSFATIPTAAERTGDFSQSGFPAIYDPTTTTCSRGVCTRQQFSYNGALNVIPPSEISPISKVLQTALPAVSNGNIQSNYLSSLTSGNTEHQYMGRMDANINAENHVYFLAQEGLSVTTGATSSLPPNIGNAGLSENNMWILQVGETWTIKSNLVNLFGVGFNRSSTPNTNTTAGTDWPSKAGLTGLPSGAVQDTFPPIGFAGPDAPLGWAGGSNRDYDDAQNTLLFQDNIEWTKGRHSLTVGSSETRVQYNYSLGNYENYYFSNGEVAAFASSSSALNTATGNPYASYLLGLVDNANVTDQAAPATSGRLSQWAIYAQDDWKLTKRLTLNIGLRYTLPKPYHEAHGHESWFDPTLANPDIGGYPGAIEFAGSGTDSCNCATQIQTHYLEFEPRFGFAYALNPKTVIRGSYGIYHFLGGALGGNDETQGSGLLGYSAEPSWVSTNNSISPAFNWNSYGVPAYAPPPFFSPTLNTGFNTTTGGTGGSVTYNDPANAGRMPYVENWNFTISRELAPSVVWQISYSANASHHLSIWDSFNWSQMQPKYLALGSLLNAQTTDTNWPSELAAAQKMFPGIGLPYANYQGPLSQMLTPFPQYSSIDDRSLMGAGAHYDSLQTSVEKKMSNGLYFQGSYVWAKSIDDSSGGALVWISSPPRSLYNVSAERSVSTLDVPNAIKALWAYSLPAGRGHLVGGQNALTDALLGGWRISGDNTYTDGLTLGTIGGACNVPNTGGCYASYNPSFTGSVRINGKFGSGNPSTTQYLNPVAFQDATPYTFGTTPRTMAFGLRNPWYLDEDASVAKNFKLTERFNLDLKWDAFNLFNRTVFAGINTNIDSTGAGGFGYVTRQANTPRQMQFETYIRF